jgi:hypothetical protein
MGDEACALADMTFPIRFSCRQQIKSISLKVSLCSIVITLGIRYCARKWTQKHSVLVMQLKVVRE